DRGAIVAGRVRNAQDPGHGGRTGDPRRHERHGTCSGGSAVRTPHRRRLPRRCRDCGRGHHRGDLHEHDPRSDRQLQQLRQRSAFAAGGRERCRGSRRQGFAPGHALTPGVADRGDGCPPARTSGPLRDPPHWSALLVAAIPADYVAVNRRVPLTGGTVDLWVRSYADDRAWGAATLDLAARALPALQKAVGLPYAGVGPLFITESMPSGVGPLAEPVTGAQDIAVGFDATPFTVLHQLAHVWIGTEFASERWIREGLASHLAAGAARQLEIAVPG